MAITVLQEPSQGASINNPLFHMVSSNLHNQPNFRYVFDIYTYDLASTAQNFLTRIKTIPRPENGNGVFDVSKIIQSLIADYFEPKKDILTLLTNGNSVNYVVKYGEYYGTTPAYYFNPATPWNIVRAYDCYPITSIDYSWHWHYPYDATKLLSNRFTTENFGTDYHALRGNQSFILPYQNKYSGDNASKSNTLRIYYKDASGTVLATLDYDFDSKMEVFHFNFGFAQIQGYYFNQTGDYLLTTEPTFDHITWQLYNVYNYIWSAEFSVFYDCSKDTPYTLHFQNANGVFESVLFNSVNRITSENERTMYKANGFVIDSGSVNEFAYFTGLLGQSTVKQPMEKVLANKSKYSLKVNSGNVTETQYQWLKELINSKRIFIEKTVNNYHPVTIKSTSWEQKFGGADKVFSLDLELSIGQVNN